MIHHDKTIVFKAYKPVEEGVYYENAGEYS